MLTTDSRRFLGGVARWWFFPSALPWGVLRVSEETCELTSALARWHRTAWLGRRVEISREATHTVAYEKIRLVFMRGPVLTFLGEDGRALGPVFGAFRPRRLRKELLSQGWPVRDFVFGFRGRRPETPNRKIRS